MAARAVCIYEDETFDQFYPLTAVRPACLLRAGILANYQKIKLHFPDCNLSLACRNRLAAVVAQNARELPVNIVKRGDGEVLFINGRIRQFGDLVSLVESATATTRFVNNGETVAVIFKADTVGKVPSVIDPSAYPERLADAGEMVWTAETSANLYGSLWNFVADIERAIIDEYEMIGGSSIPPGACVDERAWLVKPERISIGDLVTVAPGVLIDATDGPVVIGANTRIESQAAIYGPTFIGPNSVVVAGKISGSSIGHTSRVGGEIEESIFQSYVNKYHAGFIGHSYVGSWVNFGAMATNSDLKNNYSDIRVTRNGQSLDTSQMKVGSFIGDHTKFGIGTLLNTGIHIGVCCNVFGGSLVTDKEVGSFSWGGSGQWERYDFAKALATARKTCGRRSIELSASEEQLLQDVFDYRTNREGALTFQG